MSDNLSDQGDRDGFEQGWFDGLHGKAAQPRPALGIGLFDVDYMRHFSAAYKDGFETAHKELARREDLLRNRELHDGLEHARDNV